MPTGSGGVVEKARGKVGLEPGYSLMSWMRLCTSGTDLTGGVGAVDAEDEDSWPWWTADQVKQHNSADDAWMVVRGRVYNVTPYLRYHPGGVDVLLKAAGKDATELFDQYHTWVDAHGIMEACCVGRLAPSEGSTQGSASANLHPRVAAEAVAPLAASSGRHSRRIRWDEDGIQAHDAERGVLFGTMKVDHVHTPFLYVDSSNPEADKVSIHHNYLPTHVPHADPPQTAAPYELPVAELQHALGLLETDTEGKAHRPQPRWAHPALFAAQRTDFYTGEAHLATLAHGLPGRRATHHACPLSAERVAQRARAAAARDRALVLHLLSTDGWQVCMSRSEPHEPFYYHSESNVTQWERPEVE